MCDFYFILSPQYALRLQVLQCSPDHTALKWTLGQSLRCKFRISAGYLSKSSRKFGPGSLACNSRTPPTTLQGHTADL